MRQSAAFYKIDEIKFYFQFCDLDHIFFSFEQKYFLILMKDYIAFSSNLLKSS